MREVGLSGYEPASIEAIHRRRATKLATLLSGASYAEQWVPRLPGGRTADAAICVFPPNRMRHPRRSSLEYVGAFEYDVVHPAWFQRILRDEAGAMAQCLGGRKNGTSSLFFSLSAAERMCDGAKRGLRPAENRGVAPSAK